MLDLRAQLLKAGLVSKEQADKAEKEVSQRPLGRQASRGQKKHRAGDGTVGRAQQPYEEMRRLKQLSALKQMDKNQQYDVIRRWVLLNRIDKDGAFPTQSMERFFFEEMDQSVGWLMLPTSVIEQIKNGEAGVMAFMSHHGLAHAVVARDIIVDVREVIPEWIRFFESSVYGDNQP